MCPGVHCSLRSRLPLLAVDEGVDFIERDDQVTPRWRGNGSGSYGFCVATAFAERLAELQQLLLQFSRGVIGGRRFDENRRDGLARSDPVREAEPDREVLAAHLVGLFDVAKGPW